MRDRLMTLAAMGFMLAVVLVGSWPAQAQLANNPNPTYSNNIPFGPTGKGSWLAASGATSNVALSVQAPQVQISNEGTVWAYANCGIGNAVTASLGTAGTAATDYPIAPGAVVVISVAPGTTYCAGIMTTGSAELVFTPGVGL